MGVEQLFQTDLSVDLGRIEFRMPENGLNSSDIGPAVVHESGHGVTEDVTGSRFFNVGALDVATPVLS